MIPTRLPRLASLGGVTLLAALLARQWLGAPEVVYDVTTYTFQGPPGHGAGELAAFLRARSRHGPLPEGWEVTDWKGTVKGTLTGRVDLARARYEVVVTFEDDATDLERCTVTLNDEPPLVATRANGRIVERGDHAVATVSLFVPIGPRVEVALTAQAPDGTRTSQSTSCGW